MNNLSTTNILVNSWKIEKLAPLYIMRPPLYNQKELSLRKWSEEFCITILQKYFNITHESALKKIQNGHSDILNINKEKQEKSYKVNNEGVNELFRMQGHNSLELNYRFVFIHDGEMLGTTLCNKLLKILEEPKKDICIFILNNTHTPMLKTIESRAINLSLIDSPSEDYKPSFNKTSLLDTLKLKFKDEDKQLIEALSNKSLSESIEILHKSKALLNSLIDALSIYAQSEKATLVQKQDFLDLLQVDQENLVYNPHSGMRNTTWVHLAISWLP